MSNHKIVHIEIPAHDPKVGSEFYAEALGWKMQEFPEMEYIVFEAGDGPGGGFPKVDNQIKAGDVTVYVSTDDIEVSLAIIESLGGKTVIEKTEIPQTGWYAWFSDPTGNTMALYTSMNPEA